MQPVLMSSLLQRKRGHRSSAIRTYKRTSDKQQEEVSDIIQSKLSKKDGDTNIKESSHEFKFEGNGMEIHLKF